MTKINIIVALFLFVALASAANPLEGQLIRTKSNIGICLVANGTRVYIPDPLTYANLFGSASWRMVDDSTYNAIPHGPDFVRGSVLMQASSAGQIYVAINAQTSSGTVVQKIWIQNPATFTKYQFSWNNIVYVDDRVLGLIPNGGVLKMQ